MAARKRQQNQQEVDWEAITGRCLAYLCLHLGDLQKETLETQVEFLTRFGLSRADCASLVGSTKGSVTKMIQKQRKSKRRKRGTK